MEVGLFVADRDSGVARGHQGSQLSLIAVRESLSDR